MHRKFRRKLISSERAIDQLMESCRQIPVNGVQVTHDKICDETFPGPMSPSWVSSVTTTIASRHVEADGRVSVQIYIFTYNHGSSEHMVWRFPIEGFRSRRHLDLANASSETESGLRLGHSRQREWRDFSDPNMDRIRRRAPTKSEISCKTTRGSLQRSTCFHPVFHCSYGATRSNMISTATDRTWKRTIFNATPQMKHREASSGRDRTQMVRLSTQ